MTKAQNGILDQNTKLLELIYKLISDNDQDIFNAEITEAILLGICAQQALKRSLERMETKNEIINLPTSKN